jgi:hypothetical protein
MPISTEQAGDALTQMTRVVTRTLWILYAGFAFAILAYLVIFLLTSAWDNRLGTSASRQLPMYWDQWQMVFLLAGVVALYASWRLRTTLLDPKRLARKAAQLQAAFAQSQDGSAAAAGAAQELVGRIIFAHVIIWGVLEIPALLGIVDRIVSGQARCFVALVAISAIGLALQKPNPGRVAAALRAHFVA